MTIKVCQDPLNPRPGGRAAPPRTPNLAPMGNGGTSGGEYRIAKYKFRKFGILDRVMLDGDLVM